MAALDVDPGTVHDIFVRHIRHGGDPLYEPPDPADGRWHHGATVAAWYLADEPATAWAEWYRALAGTGLPPARALPRDLWRWRVDLDRVALLDDDERLMRVGLPSPLPPKRKATPPSSSPRLPVLGIATWSSSAPAPGSPVACLSRRLPR